MTVTITTDASFHYKYKIAGWAFWISTNNGSIKRSGIFKTNVANPTESELKCIANGIHVLQLSGLNVTKLIVNTDCMGGIQYHAKEKKKNSEKHRGLRNASELIKTLLDGKYPEVIFRHVKAHNGQPDARSYVNDWCDKAAKMELRKQVKILSKKNGKGSPGY